MKSYTWPLSEKDETIKTAKRRFSWENITKAAKDSKLSKLRRRRDKFNWLNHSKSKKSSPKPKSTFKTSTPLKINPERDVSMKTNKDSNFGNSTAISQMNYNNKTAEAQQTTCSDRLPTPKTSLNDFKKLLLNATNKKLSTKPSAVEQLRLRQESLAASPMKILDLSSSPKSFTNRRVFQQIQASPLSPYKKPNLMSPRSRWKYNNFNKSTIASIPEANAEDELTANDSKPTDNLNSTYDSHAAIYATPKRNPIPVVAGSSNIENNISTGIKPIECTTPMDTINSPIAEPIIAKTESSPETGIIETNFTLDDNIFLLSEENNFMKGEVKPSFAAKITTSKPTQKSIITDTPKPSEQKSDNLASRTLETSF